MRYLSNIHNITYTIRPERTRVEQGIVMRDLPLRATFRSFAFDSEATQRAMRWTDEERLQVEKELTNSPDFVLNPGHMRGVGRARIMFDYNRHPELRPEFVSEEEATPELGPMRCVFVVYDSDGGAHLCGKTVTERSDLCHTHEMEVRKEIAARRNAEEERRLQAEEAARQDAGVRTDVARMADRKIAEREEALVNRRRPKRVASPEE